MQRFQPVDPKVNFPGLERRILDFWREADVFHKSLELRKDSPEWVFYEGPPTANGRPGIHHTESRTFKDVYPRFKTMTGHFVPRKAGWDCHGLPVEIEVEKEIGTTGKRDIETFGIAEFNRLCRESVTRYVDEWEKLTDRLGFWIDTSDAYWTMDTEYVESVWWSLKQLHAKGLLFEADKVTTYCPRCGTALSDAETAMGYTAGRGPERLRAVHRAPRGGGRLDGRFARSCGPPPRGRLISNTGVAVAPDADYAIVEIDGQKLILAEALRTKVLGEQGALVGILKGAALDGRELRPSLSERRGGSFDSRRRLRIDGRWHRGRTHGSCVRRRGSRGRVAPGLAGLQADRRRGAIHG